METEAEVTRICGILEGYESVGDGQLLAVRVVGGAIIFVTVTGLLVHRRRQRDDRALASHDLDRYPPIFTQSDLDSLRTAQHSQETEGAIVECYAPATGEIVSVGEWVCVNTTDRLRFYDMNL